MSDYLRLRHNACVLPDLGGYDLSRGEMNPGVVDSFMALLGRQRGFPDFGLWEPFAGHTGRSRVLDAAEEVGMPAVAHDLDPSDFRVLRRDSRFDGPEMEIGAMLFHPPYFGTAEMSAERGELSAMGETEYKAALLATIELADQAFVPPAITCAVCRSYHSKGRRIRLEEWFLDAFSLFGVEPVEVWISEPDVAIIMQ